MPKTQETLLSLASNVEIISMEDGRIAVIFDPKKKLGASKSGKSNIVASTGGNINVNGISIGFNAYRKA